MTSGRTNSRSLSIGELATRAGIATSAVRFYEDKGLITAERNDSGHRLYPADALRRVSFIRTAQRVGMTLGEIGSALESLPAGRTPTASDWDRLATAWRPVLDERIATLTRLRDQLGECIGCGCLSLTACGIWNPSDAAGDLGVGARYLESDDRPPFNEAGSTRSSPR